MHFLAQNCQNFSVDSAKKSTFRMSARRKYEYVECLSGTRAKIFLAKIPYIWYEKAIFFVEKRHASAWHRILIWPN